MRARARTHTQPVFLLDPSDRSLTKSTFVTGIVASSQGNDKGPSVAQALGLQGQCRPPKARRLCRQDSDVRMLVELTLRGIRAKLVHRQ